MNAVFVFHFSVGVGAVDCVAVKQPLEGYSINIKRDKLLEDHVHNELLHIRSGNVDKHTHTHTHTHQKCVDFFSSKRHFFGLFICHSKSSENEVNYDGDDVWLSHESLQYNLPENRKDFFCFTWNVKWQIWCVFFCPIHIYKCSLETRTISIFHVGTKPHFCFVSTNIQNPTEIVY